MERILPPVIRVFISSTFADMENERHYFNTIIVPKLTRICADRGVSFFSVDLRWGITAEDQVSGKVLPICLREIDNCRPFFIGILGNRYGSVVSEVTADNEKVFPWLKGRAGRSVTELEMLYGVLESRKSGESTNCAFFFRSDALSESFFPERETEEKYEKLCALKANIRSKEDIPSYNYDSLEGFEGAVLSAFQEWIDREFPSVESAGIARKKWYNSELLRDYVDMPQIREFVGRYCQNDNRALLIYGDGLRGKTTVLTYWMPEEGHKILINCGADEAYGYWPRIAQDIVKEINKIDKEAGVPKFDASASMFFWMKQAMGNRRSGAGEESSEGIYYVTDKELDSFRQGFVKWLKGLKLKEPVYIVINDLNLLSNEDSYYLNWLPVETCENLHLICSANLGVITENAKTLGWNCKEMPLFQDVDAEHFLDKYMGIFGKNMSVQQKRNLFGSKLMQYPGYLKFVIRYFNNYGNFENLDRLTQAIGGMETVQELYRHVWESLTAAMQAGEKKAAQIAFYILSCTAIGLKEDDLYGLVSENTRVDALMWSNIRVILEQFGVISGEAWKIWDFELRKVVEEFPVERLRINRSLGKYFREHMDKEVAFSTVGIKKNTEFAKAAIYHYVQSKRWDGLCKILEDRVVLYYLSKLEWKVIRSAWMSVIIHSEIDASERLIRLFREIRQEKSNIEGIQRLLVSLMLDLELHRAREAAGAEESRIPQVSQLRSIGSDKMTQSVAKVYNKLCDLKDAHDFRLLYGMLKEYLEGHEETLNTYEKCYIYSLKLDCELQLKLLEVGLKTAYKYYVEAINSMSTLDTMHAVLMRGECLYMVGRVEEAVQSFDYAKKLASREGALREYLSAQNMEAMCCYRMEEYDRSIALFDECIFAWKKLENTRECLNVQINKCNAIYLKGDVEAALRDSKKLYEHVCSLSGEQYLSIKVMLLGNIGSYCKELGKLKEAEDFYLQAIELAKGRVEEQQLEKNYWGLIGLYKEQKLYAKAIQTYEGYLDFLHQNHRYTELAETVRQAVELMHHAKYEYEAKEAEAKWQKIFEGIPGGAELWKGAFAGESDPHSVEELKKQLAMAKSEKDFARCGELQKRLAFFQEKSDKVRALDLFLQAMESFQAAKAFKEAKSCLYLAVKLVMAGGGSSQESHVLWEKMDEQEREVVTLWKELVVKEAPSQEYAQRISQMFRYAGTVQELVGIFLLSEVENLAEKCTVEQLFAAIALFKESDLGNDFTDALQRELLKDLQRDISFLMRDFSSTRAEQKLDFYEKAAKVLEKLDSEDTAAVAGNIALIFRRRRDKDKTIFYHKMSMELYKKAGKERDYYIEELNLATAHRDFGEIPEAIDNLRGALQELENSQCRDLRAAIAGNLAAVLIMEQSSADEEITRCFEIEEGYYRAVNEERELVISLLNQVKYYLGDREKNGSVLREKFKKAEEIVKRHRFMEFYQAIRQMGAMMPAEQERSGSSILRARQQERRSGDLPGQNAFGGRSAGELLNKLIEENGSYEISEITEERNHFMRFLCMPKEQIPTMKQNLHLMLDTDKAMFRCLFVMQPTITHAKTEMLMRQYAAWWNEQDDYELRFEEEGLIILADECIIDSNWGRVAAFFKRMDKLWTVDVLNMSMGVIGMTDLEEFQQIKLKIMQEM